MRAGPFPCRAIKISGLFLSGTNLGQGSARGRAGRPGLEGLGSGVMCIRADAPGLAVFTILKAGFVFSGKAGSGLVVARLPDGSWSAPSCIATAGVGWGLQIGAGTLPICLTPPLCSFLGADSCGMTKVVHCHPPCLADVSRHY